MVETTVRRARDPAMLLAILDEAYNRRTWSGTNVRKSLRGITAAGAAWRPPHARHNIAQIVLHLAYWKTIVCGRLDRERTPGGRAAEDEERGGGRDRPGPAGRDGSQGGGPHGGCRAGVGERPVLRQVGGPDRPGWNVV